MTRLGTHHDVISAILSIIYIHISRPSVVDINRQVICSSPPWAFAARNRPLHRTPEPLDATAKSVVEIRRAMYFFQGLSRPRYFCQTSRLRRP
jgi:hypothetical protein